MPRAPSDAPMEMPTPMARTSDISLHTMRPYSYHTGFDPCRRRIGGFRDEISAISRLTATSEQAIISSSLKTLAQLTPYLLDAFKYEFKHHTGKDLHKVCSCLVAKPDEKMRTLVAALTLGPIEFDLHLLSKAESRKIDNDLIHIFVGREQSDLQDLNSRWQSQAGSNLTSAIRTWTSNKNLQHALNICTSNSRDSPSKPVDRALIHRDVNRIEDLLKRPFSSTPDGGYSRSSDLLRIILYHNNPAIQQLSLYFESATGCKLDEKIRKSTLDDTTKKIAVHAVRTARDLTYRDLMSLKDVMGKPGKEVDLAIRICRGHWYGMHWKQVQAAAMGTVNLNIGEKLGEMSKGIFRDLLMAMVKS
jgi:hypothetical protein